MTSPSVVIVGGGGHAAVCLDVVRSRGVEPLGYIANERSSLDLPYLGADDALAAMEPESVSILIAIGDNRTRTRIRQQMNSAGFSLFIAVHSSATISPSATLGAGTVVMPGAIINARSRVGEAVIVNTAATIDHDGVIGDGVHIAPGCHLAGSVEIGDGAFLGAGTIVIPEQSIGAWAVVGAGSVVVRDVPSDTRAMGVPARWTSA